MTLRAVLTLLAALAFVGLSYAAPEFRGYTADQLPLAEARPAIQPAGYAFAIWGAIYAWLVAGAGWGVWRRADDPAWDRHRLPLILAMGLGAAWLWIAVRDPVAATVAIWAMLGLAVWALLRAPAGPGPAFWLARVPMGLFAGWLTAAACVSLGVVLAGTGWLPSSRVAAWVLIPVAAGLALAVLRATPPAGAYALAAGWGLAGIAVQNGTDRPDVAALALLGCAALGLGWWRARRLAGTGLAD